YYQVSTRRVIESTYNYILIAGAAMMSWVLSYYQALDPGVNYLIENDFSPTVFLLILMLIYVVLGTFMEPNSAMLIIVPLSVPIIQGLGIDPIAAGIVTVMSIRLGTVTPPYGLSALLASKIAGTNMLKMMKQIIIFVFIYLAAILLIIYIPQIATFLPNLLMD